VIALLALDFLVTRKPHEVSMKEATAGRSSTSRCRSPSAPGSGHLRLAAGVEYLTGYLVEKSLSVDNLFVFMLLLTAFAVPAELQQRVLLYGIVGALVLRGIFIALGRCGARGSVFAFLLFGVILLLTAVKILRDHRKGQDQHVDIESMRSVRLLRRFMPVTDDYHGPRLFVRLNGVRALTPFALVTVAVFATDVVFAVDSVPAVYGITGRPVPGLRHQRLRAAGPAGAVLRPAGALSSSCTWLRPGGDPRLHRRQAGAALGARRVARRARGPDAVLVGSHRRGPVDRHGDEPVRDSGLLAPGRRGDARQVLAGQVSRGSCHEHGIRRPTGE
jgi:hypothetical protein